MRIVLVMFIILAIIFFKYTVRLQKYNIIELYILINLSSICSIVILGFIDIFALLILLEVFSFVIISLNVLDPKLVNIKSARLYFAYNTVIGAISALGVFGIFFSLKTLQFFFCNEIFQIIIIYATFKFKMYIYCMLGL